MNLPKSILLLSLLMISFSCSKEKSVFMPTPNYVQTVQEDDDGGWTSAGGGEYIVDRHNPWFMGSEPVTWCIDHGGENFSLPLTESTIQAKGLIDILAVQLKELNDSSGLRRSESDWHNSSINLKCGMVKNDDGQWEKVCDPSEKKMVPFSDKFIFSETCANADLELILGNTENPKISKLVNYYGKEQFRKFGALSIRTEYDQANLRGKGFIYFAADSGDLSYSGERSLIFDFNSIWNSKSEVPFEAAFPALFVFNTLPLGDYNQILMENNLVSPFRPVLLHEFSHVLGFEHDEEASTFMGVDYPSLTIKNGFEIKSRFDYNLNFLRNNLFSLHEKPTSVALAADNCVRFPWWGGRDRYPYIFDFLFAGRDVQQDPNPASQCRGGFKLLNPQFIFNVNKLSGPHNVNGEGEVILASVIDEEMNLKVDARYNVKYLPGCPDWFIDEKKSKTRVFVKKDDYVFSRDQNSDTWETRNQSSKIIQDFDFLTLGRTTLCGFIEVKDKSLKFTLTFGSTDHRNKPLLKLYPPKSDDGLGLDQFVSVEFQAFPLITNNTETLPKAKVVLNYVLQKEDN